MGRQEFKSTELDVVGKSQLVMEGSKPRQEGAAPGAPQPPQIMERKQLRDYVWDDGVGVMSKRQMQKEVG